MLYYTAGQTCSPITNMNQVAHDWLTTQNKTLNLSLHNGLEDIHPN